MVRYDIRNLVFIRKVSFALVTDMKDEEVVLSVSKFL